jgi:hypothetical protein
VAHRPGLECVVILNNIEARFKQEYNHGPFASSVRQYDADSALVRSHDVTLATSLDIAEVRMEPIEAGCGFVTVDVTHLHSDLYVTLSDGNFYTATHGRHEFIEYYPARTRAFIAVLGRLLVLGGRTIPAFTRDQYVYLGADSRSHLLLMNLSNVTSRIRVVASDGPRRLPGQRLLAIPPMGRARSGPMSSASRGARRPRFDGCISKAMLGSTSTWSEPGLRWSALADACQVASRGCSPPRSTRTATIISPSSCTTVTPRLAATSPRSTSPCMGSRDSPRGQSRSTGGVPDRVGATGPNNFGTYLFRGQSFAERYSVLLGNVARFAVAQVQVFAYYGLERLARNVTLEPKAHADAEIAPEQDGRWLERVEVKPLFRLASYVVGRHAQAGDLVLFDHLFTYFK